MGTIPTKSCNWKAPASRRVCEAVAILAGQRQRPSHPSPPGRLFLFSGHLHAQMPPPPELSGLANQMVFNPCGGHVWRCIVSSYAPAGAAVACICMARFDLRKILTHLREVAFCACFTLLREVPGDTHLTRFSTRFRKPLTLFCTLFVCLPLKSRAPKNIYEGA